MERDGSLDLETAQDTFDRTYAKAIDVAERFDAEVDGDVRVGPGSQSADRGHSPRSDVRGRHAGTGGRTEQPATSSRLVVTISEPRNLANTVRSTWGIARNVMLYSVQAMMLLVAFAIPFLIVIVLVRLGLSGWRRLVGAAKERRPRPNDRPDRPEPPSAERPPSDGA